MTWFMRQSCQFCYLQKEQFRVEYLDEEIAIFHDIRPASQIHLLAIPRKHVSTTSSLRATDIALLRKLEAKSREVLNRQSHLMRDLNGNIPIIFGFHVRPFTSVQHLHLHVLVPPFKRFKQWKYDSRFCWFSTLEEVIGKLSIELKTKQRSQNELHHD